MKKLIRSNTVKARLVSIACLLVGAVCHADIIGTDPIPPASHLTGFGSSEVYRGQTFRLPPGPAVIANSLTVFVGPTSDAGANFRVLITEVDMTNGFHPTNVLFESETLNVPILPLRRNPDAFVIDLGGLVLESDRDYAWILDHFVVGTPGTVVSMGTGLGDYPDGMAFRFPNGPFFPPGTREDHFASNNWFVEGDRDFAFQLEFTSAAGKPHPDIKANGHDGLVTVPAGTPVSVTLSLAGGEAGSEAYEWWVGAATPLGWFSYVYPTGWTLGLQRCAVAPLFDFSTFEILDAPLPAAPYIFYFVLDREIDGVPRPPSWGDGVAVHVQ